MRKFWIQPLPAAVGRVSSFTFYFMLVAALLAGGATLGFTGDESGYVAPNTLEFSTHLWRPYLDKIDTGHPMLYAWLTGVFWRLFGRSNALAYISIWAYTALTLATLHSLTLCIVRGRNGRPAPRWAGPAASLCLLATPLFINHAAQYLDAIPFTAFFLLMILTWARGERGWLGFWCTMLAMTRITGCLGVLGLGLYDLARGWFVQRRRSPGALARLMLPYILSGAVLVLYFFVKLYVLKRPFNNFKKNDFSFNNLGQFYRYLRYITDVCLNFPPLSFNLLLVPAGAAALLTAWKAWRRRGRTPRECGIRNAECENTLKMHDKERQSAGDCGALQAGAQAGAATSTWLRVYRDLKNEASDSKQLTDPPQSALATETVVAGEGVHTPQSKAGETSALPVFNPQSAIRNPQSDRSAFAIYSAMVAAIVPWYFFYAAYFMSPNPRWFLSVHALFVIMGIHGLIILLGRWRALALPLLALWCVWVGMRWHQAWFERATRDMRPSVRRRYAIRPDLSMDLFQRKAATQQIIDWVETNTGNDLILSGYPTSSAFYLPASGFTNCQFKKVLDFSWLGLRRPLDQEAPALSAENAQIIMVVTNWDKSANFTKFQDELLKRMPGETVLQGKLDSGEWYKIIRCRRSR